MPSHLLSCSLISAQTAFSCPSYNLDLFWGSQAQQYHIYDSRPVTCHSSTVLDMYAAFLTTFLSSSIKKSINPILFQCSPSFLAICLTKRLLGTIKSSRNSGNKTTSHVLSPCLFLSLAQSVFLKLLLSQIHTGPYSHSDSAMAKLPT